MDSCHSGFIRLRYHLNNACPSYISPPWPTRYRKDGYRIYCRISLHLYPWLYSSQSPEGDDAHFGCYLWFLLDVRSAKGSDGERDCEWPTRRLAFCIVHTGRNSGGVCVTSIIPIARSVNVRAREPLKQRVLPDPKSTTSSATSTDAQAPYSDC